MKRYAAENKDLRVYDAETGEMLHGIQWFDDETLEYEQSVHFMTEDRTTVFYFNDPDNPERLLSEVRQGGIIVKRIEEAA